ncbi:Hypothetical_protein [Hexamita inflata]|uniref:Hypothetical_protein n=1 Tax=Hexamita inflata TaxID=28002 RepID=A0AA86V3G3_9EUKA|nr:Hypothetical protein HINF_LOCUS62506 [Hexamita inflata]
MFQQVRIFQELTIFKYSFILKTLSSSQQLNSFLGIVYQLFPCSIFSAFLQLFLIEVTILEISPVINSRFGTVDQVWDVNFPWSPFSFLATLLKYFKKNQDEKIMIYSLMH